MRLLHLTLALVLLAVPLTGCLGFGGDEGTTESGLETKSKATVSSDAGGIEGIVTDPAVQPLEGVNVSIEGLGEETRTADDGSFAVSEVPPGSYTLAFTHAGFISTQKTVTVDAGSVSTVEIVLAHAPTVTPYMEQLEFTGFMECSAGAGVIGGAVSGNPCQTDATNTQTTFSHDIQPNAWQMVTEVTWDPTSPLADRFWVNVEPDGFNSAWKVAYANTRAEEPVVTVADRAHLTGIAKNFTAICNGEEDPEITSNHANNPDAYCNRHPIQDGDTVNIDVLVQSASTFPTGTAGVGVAVQQQFQVYQTVFYNAPACEDYSLVEDNQCEQMSSPPEEDPYDEISGGNETTGDGAGGR